MAYRRLTDLYIDIVEGKTDEASIDLLRKKLRKVKGITKDQIAVLSTMPTPVLTSVINQLSLIVSQKEEVDEVNEGMVDIEKARKLPDKIQKQILDLKKEYDRTWDGVFVPMGKDGSSQRKEYERRGKLFKAASKKYKDFLKKHKVANFK